MTEYDVIVSALNAMPADIRPTELVNRDRASRSLEALRKAGYAIVAMPEVKVTEWADSYWPVPEAASDGREGKVKIEEDGRIHASMVSNPLPTPRAARAYAAALLAAADSDEAGGGER